MYNVFISKYTIYLKKAKDFLSAEKVLVEQEFTADEKEILKGLNRPIELKAIDLDGDGQEELISSEFGFMVGGMTVWKQQGGSWSKKVLNPQTGATHVDVRDVNGDGLDDIYLGGAAGQIKQLFVQKPGGIFVNSPQADFSLDQTTENTDAIFFDADKDGDQDLL